VKKKEYWGKGKEALVSEQVEPSGLLDVPCLHARKRGKSKRGVFVLSSFLARGLYSKSSCREGKGSFPQSRL